MSKKVLAVIIIFSCFSVLSILLIGISEIIAFYSFGNGNIIDYFWSSSETPKIYTIITYGVSAMIAMHFSVCFFVYLCSKNKFGLTTELAVQLIDDEGLRKVYIKEM